MPNPPVPSDASGAAAGEPVGGLRRGRPSWSRSAVVYSLVVLIVLADWLTAAGVVVGILLGVPILLSSAGNDPREVVIATMTAIIGFTVAAVFGRGPISPEAIWLPNRVFAMVAIAASGVVSLLLQKRRIEADAARAEAESARDLNRLLHSLMAHDLRAPLALARQAIEAVERPIRSGEPVDLSLVADVDARLRRSLRTIQLVLDSARSELDAPARAEPPLINVGAEVRDEAASFEEEARSRGKELRAVPPDADVFARVDPAVLRQSLAILLDNAIRYSVPGHIRITVAIAGPHVVIGVSDQGPGLTRRPNPAGSGEGLGLKLCELLARRSGGTLSVARDAEDGTEFALRLPIQRRD